MNKTPVLSADKSEPSHTPRAADFMLTAGDFPAEALMNVTAVRNMTHELNVKGQALTDLQASYRELAVMIHISKVGGSATHAGAFDRCKSKLCVKSRAALSAAAAAQVVPNKYK